MTKWTNEAYSNAHLVDALDEDPAARRHAVHLDLVPGLEHPQPADRQVAGVLLVEHGVRLAEQPDLLAGVQGARDDAAKHLGLRTSSNNRLFDCF